MIDKDPNDIPNESGEVDDGDIKNLSQTEKAAFEKIMAQISEEESQDAASSPSSDKPSPSKASDSDSSASQTDDIDPQPAPQAEEAGNSEAMKAEDDLSDDQRAALDKIMAEIGGEDTAPSEPAPPDEDDAEGDDQSDDQQAALDKIMSEIKDDDSDDVESTDSNTDDADLTDDQQVALDKIMAEIKSDDSEAVENAESKTNDGTLTNDQQAALDKIMAEIDGDEPQNDAQPPQPSADKSQDNENGEGLSMEEFDDELSSLLAPSEENSSTDGDAEKVPAQTKAPSKPQERSLEDINSALKSIVKESNESQEEDTPSGDEALDDTEAATAQAEKPPTSTLKEVSAPAKQKTPRTAFVAKLKKPLISTVIGCMVILVAVGVYGFYLHFFKLGPAKQAIKNRSENAPINPPISPALPPSTAATVDTSPQNPAPDGPAGAHKPAKTSPFENLKIEILSARQKMQSKKEEILELKRYYQNGIKEERGKLLALQPTRPKSFTAATGQRQIELGLKSIQRRTDYSNKLDTPLGQVESYLEQLLYLERRIRLFELLDTAISGLSLSDLKHQGTALIQDIIKGGDKLSIEQVKTDPPGLKAIWQSLYADSTPPENIASRPNSRLSALDQQISRSICNNDYERKYLLTALTPQTAECLAQWPGKDLYLNSVTYLSPQAAEALARWPGEWLSLNGLKNLPPESARHLSRWPGKRLSLNGLDRLSKETTSYLAQWQGDQLEMIGLTSIGRWENYVTHLYLSEQLRHKLQVQ